MVFMNHFIVIILLNGSFNLPETLEIGSKANHTTILSGAMLTEYSTSEWSSERKDCHGESELGFGPRAS
jgi:hypothetical protein